MNWKRAALAAGAGVAGVVVICAGLYVALLIAFYNWSPIGGGDPSVNVVQLLLFLTIPPVLFCAGGALPARALGAGWWRSLAIALVAHAIAVLVLILMLLWEPFDDLRLYVVAIFVPAAASTTLLAIRYGSSPTGLGGSVATIAAAALIFCLYLVLPYLVVVIAASILAWVLLPVIAAIVRF